ncbi:MAG: hypothetical protein LBU85_02355 [Treponema sp.]|jgi:hypothetical protein|nr:hypothetical protein [Treponema sp.]
MEQFVNNGLNVRFVPIGREAFVFFVNKNNIVDNITIEIFREYIPVLLKTGKHYTEPIKESGLFNGRKIQEARRCCKR